MAKSDRILSLIGRGWRAPQQIWPYLQYKANALPGYWSASGRSWPPRKILLGVNSVCGERCAMCDFGQKATDRMFYLNLRPTRRAISLPPERLYALIEAVMPFRPIIEAHTVEPTLYPQLPELAACAQQNNLPFRIFTNGARLAEMADALVAANVDQIYVSIDGPPAIHDAIRGREGSFTRAITGIAAVAEAKRQRPNSRTKVRVNCTISDWNYRYLVALVTAVDALAPPFCFMFMHLNFVTEAMVAHHNPQFGHVCRATPMGIGGTDPTQVDTAVLYRQLRQLKQQLSAHRLLIQPNLTSQADLDTYYHQPETFLRRQRCFMPWRTVMVIPNGDVIVRNRCYHLVFGNIFEDTLMNIWNNDAYRTFRAALRQAGTFPACARCYGAFE